MARRAAPRQRLAGSRKLPALASWPGKCGENAATKAGSTGGRRGGAPPPPAADGRAGPPRAHPQPPPRWCALHGSSLQLLQAEAAQGPAPARRPRGRAARASGGVPERCQWVRVTAEAALHCHRPLAGLPAGACWAASHAASSVRHRGNAPGRSPVRRHVYPVREQVDRRAAAEQLGRRLVRPLRPGPCRRLGRRGAGPQGRGRRTAVQQPAPARGRAPQPERAGGQGGAPAAAERRSAEGAVRRQASAANAGGLGAAGRRPPPSGSVAVPLPPRPGRPSGWFQPLPSARWPPLHAASVSAWRPLACQGLVAPRHGRAGVPAARSVAQPWAPRCPPPCAAC